MEEKILVDLNADIETSSSIKNEIKLINGNIEISYINYVDKTLPSGRWIPAFPPATLDDQEEYILKMLERDKND